MHKQIAQLFFALCHLTIGILPYDTKFGLFLSCSSLGEKSSSIDDRLQSNETRRRNHAGRENIANKDDRVQG